MPRRSVAHAIVLLIVAARAWPGEATLPTAAVLREGLRRELLEMPSLMRYYAFADLEAKGLTFEPGPGQGSFETGRGRWAEQKAVRLDPAEWDGADIEEATVIDRSPNVGPSPAPKSYAWIRRDDSFLYLGVMNLVNPQKPMVKDENTWWRGDMMEVIIEGHVGVGTQGWWLDEAEHGPLFYLVGDFQGNFDSIQIAGLPRAQATKLRRTARYAAAAKDASCWTAEWRIPFASVCLDPVHTQACCFNIGVGKPGTRVNPAWPQSKLSVAKWVAWASANGPNWEVWNAGRLVLNR